MSKRQQTFDSSNAFPRYHEKLRRSSISDNDNPFASFPLPTSLQDPDRNENNKITHQEPVVFVPPPRPSDPQSQAQASTVPNQDTTNNSIPTQSPNFSSGTANEIPPVSVSLDEIFQDIFERTRCSAIPLIVLKGPSGEMPLQDVLVKLQATLQVGVSELSVARTADVRDPSEKDLIDNIGKQGTVVAALIQSQQQRIERLERLLARFGLA